MGKVDLGPVVGRGTEQNLLDNWYFVDPINQRNVSGNITTTGYFIDRWKLISGTVELTSAGLVLNGTIAQILETAPLGTVTASALTTSGMVTPTYDVSSKTFSITGSSQTFVAAKLELGSQQTLAHQDVSGNWVLNDPQPNKELELLKCRQYYFPPALEERCGAKPFGATLMVPITACMRATPAAINDPEHPLEVFLYNRGWVSATLNYLLYHPDSVILYYNNPDDLLQDGNVCLVRNTPALSCDL